MDHARGTLLRRLHEIPVGTSRRVDDHGLLVDMTNPSAPQRYRGRIESSVVVYDLTVAEGQNNRFELTPVRSQSWSGSWNSIEPPG